MSARRRRALSWALVSIVLAGVGAAFLGIFWDGADGSGTAPLPALAVDLERTSVSGLSAGAYMAGQFQVAHGDIVVGAGLIAGGPYGCAESGFSRLWPIWATALPHNLQLALNACTDDSLAIMGKPDIGLLAQRTRELADADKIAPLEMLQSDRVYLFHARNDGTVARSVVEAAARYYQAVGVPEDNLRLVRFDRGAHAFITLEAGAECGMSGPPYLNDCDYDQAGAILQHLYPGVRSPRGSSSGSFETFAQTRYLDGAEKHSMAKEGIVYIPRQCQAGSSCAVHVVFHGCEQNRGRIGDAFIRGSGYARWADANDLIILFPQVRKSAVNPRACWDWWGYTGLDFRERSAPQIAAVRAMLSRLAQQP